MTTDLSASRGGECTESTHVNKPWAGLFTSSPKRAFLSSFSLPMLLLRPRKTFSRKAQPVLLRLTDFEAPSILARNFERVRGTARGVASVSRGANRSSSSEEEVGLDSRAEDGSERMPMTLAGGPREWFSPDGDTPELDLRYIFSSIQEWHLLLLSDRPPGPSC